MVCTAPRARGNVSLPGQGRRPAPLLITAQLPADVLAWADALRREHYPPERNRLAAHVTLFHGLPPSAGHEIRTALAQTAAGNAPPLAQIAGIMRMDRGTALKVASHGMAAIHADLAERFHGLLSRQDAGPLVLHITIQNKVSPRDAQRLQAMLETTLKPRKFAFPGLALHLYRDGLWEFVQSWRFRGAKGG